MYLNGTKRKVLKSDEYNDVRFKVILDSREEIQTDPDIHQPTLKCYWRRVFESRGRIDQIQSS